MFIGLLPIVALIIALGAGCTPSASTKPCPTLQACRASGAQLLGQQVLIPQGATFVRGAVQKGVLGVDFLDPPTGRTFSILVGHPGNKKASCPGTIIQIATNRSICYGHTNTALVAQFFVQNLLYSVTVSIASGSVSPPQTSAASEQDLVTRIVAEMN